jgi:hypothetical protein
MARQRAVIQIDLEADGARQSLSSLEGDLENVEVAASQAGTTMSAAIQDPVATIGDLQGSLDRTADATSSVADQGRRTSQVFSTEVPRGFERAGTAGAESAEAMDVAFERSVQAASQTVSQTSSLEASFQDLQRRSDLVGEDLRSAFERANQEMRNTSRILTTELPRGFERVESAGAEGGEAAIRSYSDLVDKTQQTVSATTRLEASYGDLQQRAQLTADDLQEAQVAAAGAGSGIRQMGGASGSASQAVFALSQGIQDLSFARSASDAVRFAGNNFSQFAQAAGTATTQAGSFTALLSSLSPVTLGVGALTAVTAVLPTLIDQFSDAEDAADRFRKAMERAKEATDRVASTNVEVGGVQIPVPEIEPAIRQAQSRIIQYRTTIEDLRREIDRQEESQQQANETLAAGGIAYTQSSDRARNTTDAIEAQVERLQRQISQWQGTIKQLREAKDEYDANTDAQRRLKEITDQSTRSLSRQRQEAQATSQALQQAAAGQQARFEAGFGLSVLDVANRELTSRLPSAAAGTAFRPENRTLPGGGPGPNQAVNILQKLETSAQQAAAAFSNMGLSAEEMKVRLMEMGFSAEEAEKAVRGIATSAERTAQQVINAAGQMGAALVQAFREGEDVAQSLFQTVLSGVAAVLTATGNPVAGAGFSAASQITASFAHGGEVRGRGTTTSDSIPAMLSDREFVVNAASAQAAPSLVRLINERPEAARQVERMLVEREARERVLTSTDTRSVQHFQAGGEVRHERVATSERDRMVLREAVRTFRTSDTRTGAQERLMQSLQDREVVRESARSTDRRERTQRDRFEREVVSRADRLVVDRAQEVVREHTDRERLAASRPSIRIPSAPEQDASTTYIGNTDTTRVIRELAMQQATQGATREAAVQPSVEPALMGAAPSRIEQQVIQEARTILDETVPEARTADDRLMIERAAEITQMRPQLRPMLTGEVPASTPPALPGTGVSASRPLSVPDITTSMPDQQIEVLVETSARQPAPDPSETTGELRTLRKAVTSELRALGDRVESMEVRLDTTRVRSGVDANRQEADELGTVGSI